MIESLAIKNFRCYKKIELSGLKRINVIVGRNSSGKTVLLESLFLAAGGSPEIALRLRLWRGLGREAQISIDRQSYESLWKDLFFSLDQNKAISIDIKGSPANTRSLTIAYKDQSTLTLPLGKREIETFVIVPIVFEWRDSRGQVSSVEVKITKEGLNIGGIGETVPIAFFSSTIAALNPSENAARFSDLSKQNKEQPLIESLKREFPYIEGLSVEINAGVPTIYASIKAFPEKIPLGLISSGVNKLLSLLVAIASYPQGVILIDEIENGFYHERLASIWTVLLRLCKRNDTQIFATTHSVECLRAALPSIRGNESEFCLIRTEKENGECAAKVFSSREFESAIEQEIEVR